MMKKMSLLLLVVILTNPCLGESWKWNEFGLEKTDNPCAVPTPWPAENWKWKWYEQFKKTDYSGWGKNVVFLGDSITYGWNRQTEHPDGVEVLKQYAISYPHIRPYSLGVSGDKPENTLWWITDGEILKTFTSPKVIVLMIGVNSLLGNKRTPEEVSGGIKSIIAVLRRSKPNSKVLLLGVLPCWGAENPIRAQIKKTNQIISGYSDRKNVFFLNFGDKLLNSDGNINPDFTYDNIHLTEYGYELWASIMFPYLDDLIKNGGNGDMWNKQKTKETK